MGKTKKRIFGNLSFIYSELTRILFLPAYIDIFSKDNLEIYAPEEFKKCSEELKSKSEEYDVFRESEHGEIQ